MIEIYPLFPRPADFELAEIARMTAAKPAFAIVFDFALDGRDDLRFSRTHPLTNRYILDNFIPVAVSTDPAVKKYAVKP